MNDILFFFKGNILRIENRPEQMIWKETLRKLIYRLMYILNVRCSRKKGRKGSKEVSQAT